MILTWMVIISPVFLPSFNLMLDVPVAALILCSVAVFLRAADQNSLQLATLAGLIGGIAAQTKYNGLVVVPVILLYAIMTRKLRLGIIAVFAVSLIFLSWEGFITWRAGRSHFLAQSQVYGSVHLLAKYRYLAWPLVTITGAVAPAITVLALVALRASKRTIVILSAVLCLGYFLIAFVPGSYQELTRDARTGEPRLTLAWLIFSAYGVVFGTAFGAVLWRLTRLSKGVATLIRRRKRFQAELFLVGWLATRDRCLLWLLANPRRAALPGPAGRNHFDHWPAGSANLPDTATKIAFSQSRVCGNAAGAALLRCRFS